MDRNLTAFLAVARSQTLTEAADALRLTQPSITKRIANLEDALGAKLFDRQWRGMTLTNAGQIFLEHAVRIEREYGQAHEEVGAIVSAGLSVLRVGAGPLFHLIYVAPLFTKLKRRFPLLSFELVAGGNIQTIPMLLNHELDLVLGLIDPDAVDPFILTHPITTIEHGIVLPSNDARASQAAIDPSDFTDKAWVLYTEDPETEGIISDHYRKRGIAPPGFDVRTSSFATGLHLVVQGGFVMSAPLQLSSIVEKEGLTIRPVRHRMPKRKAGLHLRRSSANVGAVKAVVDMLPTMIADTKDR